MTAKCENCDATGWVCENHPDRPWRAFSSRSDPCDCGARGIVRGLQPIRCRSSAGYISNRLQIRHRRFAALNLGFRSKCTGCAALAAYAAPLTIVGRSLAQPKSRARPWPVAPRVARLDQAERPIGGGVIAGNAGQARRVLGFLHLRRFGRLLEGKPARGGSGGPIARRDAILLCPTGHWVPRRARERHLDCPEGRVQHRNLFLRPPRVKSPQGS